MRISDWSSDVCSSDLSLGTEASDSILQGRAGQVQLHLPDLAQFYRYWAGTNCEKDRLHDVIHSTTLIRRPMMPKVTHKGASGTAWLRSEEHTSELQSLMRISYAVFCLKKKTTHRLTRD